MITRSDRLSLRILVASLVFATFALDAIAQSQQNTSAGATSGPPTASRDTPVKELPKLAVMECEETKCVPWTFFGSKAVANWPSGEEAVLEIVSRSGGQVIKIERTDVAGPRQGKITEYKGTIDGKIIQGSYECAACTGQDSSGPWYFLDAGSQLPPPQIAHFCDPAHCLTFNLIDGKLINSTNLPYQSGERRILTLQSFSSESVDIDRVDYGNYPLTARYLGRITEDGLASGTTGNGKQWRMSWGPKINEIVSEDDRNGSPVEPSPGFSSVTPHDFVAFLTALLDCRASGYCGD